MNILLDTTYFLPLYNIAVSVPNDALIEITKRQHKYYYTDLVYFECNAKASKYHCTDLTNASIALSEAIEWDEIITKNQSIWELACFFRKYHTDYIDCIHYATAIIKKIDYFLSEEKELKKKINTLTSDFTTQFGNLYQFIPLINYSEYLVKFPVKKTH
jgi:predicted nucleic acid-binding protein